MKRLMVARRDMLISGRSAFQPSRLHPSTNLPVCAFKHDASGFVARSKDANLIAIVFPMCQIAARSQTLLASHANACSLSNIAITTAD